MEPHERPTLYYLVKRGKNTNYILAATDVRALYLRENKGLQWLGGPYKTRSEAKAALALLEPN